jgi:hypothetical protein
MITGTVVTFALVCTLAGVHVLISVVVRVHLGLVCTAAEVLHHIIS